MQLLSVVAINTNISQSEATETVEYDDLAAPRRLLECAMDGLHKEPSPLRSLKLTLLPLTYFNMPTSAIATSGHEDLRLHSDNSIRCLVLDASSVHPSPSDRVRLQIILYRREARCLEAAKPNIAVLIVLLAKHTMRCTALGCVPLR